MFERLSFVVTRWLLLAVLLIYYLNDTLSNEVVCLSSVCPWLACISKTKPDRAIAPLKMNRKCRNGVCDSESVARTFAGSKKIWQKCVCARNKSAIPTTGHPMDFVFVSKVGYSGSADRMALFPVGSNQIKSNLKNYYSAPYNNGRQRLTKTYRPNYKMRGKIQYRSVTGMQGHRQH